MSPVQVAQIEREYQRLQQDMADLQALLQNPSAHADWQDRLREEFQLLYGDLVRYFELQEQDGYLDQVETNAPQYHEHVLDLHQEQGDILRRLEDIQDRFAQLKSESCTDLCAQLADLLAKIQEHEHRKNDLVQSAFNIVPGTMD